MTVYNLVFPATDIHPPGFGYLVPRPTAGYHSSGNPGILGTVFDSCALSQQDTPADAQLTKVTVMHGGPHHSPPPSLSKLLQHLAFQLDVPSLPTPLVARINHHSNCIPVPTTGHLARMKELNAKLEGGVWDGRLEVIGAGVKGVSVGDCVESGRNVGSKWR